MAPPPETAVFWLSVLLSTFKLPLFWMAPPEKSETFWWSVLFITVRMPMLSMPPPSEMAWLADIVALLTVRKPWFKMPPPKALAPDMYPLEIVTPEITAVRLYPTAVSYTHLRAHETRHDIVCRLLLEKK